MQQKLCRYLGLDGASHGIKRIQGRVVGLSLQQFYFMHIFLANIHVLSMHIFCGACCKKICIRQNYFLHNSALFSYDWMFFLVPYKSYSYHNDHVYPNRPVTHGPAGLTQLKVHFYNMWIAFWNHICSNWCRGHKQFRTSRAEGGEFLGLSHARQVWSAWEHLVWEGGKWEGDREVEQGRWREGGPMGGATQERGRSLNLAVIWATRAHLNLRLQNSRHRSEQPYRLFPAWSRPAGSYPS